MAPERADAPHENERYRESCCAREGRNNSKRCHGVMRISGDDNKYRLDSTTPRYFTETG